MFQDSFGNTLPPLIVDTYKDEYFLQSVPYSVEEYMTRYHTDTVIAEKAERKLCEIVAEE